MNEEERWAYVYLSGSACFYSGELEIIAVIVNATVHATQHVSLYDGTSALDKKIADLYNTVEVTRGYNFSKPVPLTNGLYVGFDTNTLSVTVIWRPVSKVA